jgi:Response regulator containing a CheY-like receiver domain and an HTH DNA-binding domain
MSAIAYMMQLLTFQLILTTVSLKKHVSKIADIVLNSENKNNTENSVKIDTQDLIIFHKSLHTPVHLSGKQAGCLKLLAEGKTSKEIADIMHLSYRTVEDYIAKTIELLGCASSKELIALYYDQP